MKERNQDLVKKTLKPYRKAIDRLDEQLLALLGKRFGIVRKVADIKIKNDIPAFLGDRVDQVRARATAMGKKYGIDPSFVYTLYTLLIYQSCATEDVMKHQYMVKKTRKKTSAAPKKAAKKTKKKS